MKSTSFPQTSKYYKRLCGVVDAKHYFFVRNGEKVKNLSELRKTLEKINPQDFAHHVNDKRNDFADWVGKVIGDESLAAKMRRTPDPKVMAALLGYRIAWLEFKVEAKRTPR